MTCLRCSSAPKAIKTTPSPEITPKTSLPIASFTACATAWLDSGLVSKTAYTLSNLNKARTGHLLVLQNELSQVDKLLQQTTARKNKLFSLFEEDKVSQDFLKERLFGLDKELTALGDRKSDLEIEIDS